MARRKFKDIDRGWKKRKGELQRTKRSARVLVGIQGQEAAAANGDATNAEVATWNEFGTIDGHIPERSFVRATMDANALEYKAMAKKLSIAVVDGKTTQSLALEIIGQKMQADMRGLIADGIEPENAPSTVKAKGSSKPLIDSGQMRNGITYKVEA